MATDREYELAAQAVNEGTANDTQLKLNSRMAKHARAGNPLAQAAQDAQKGKLKKK